MKDTLDVLPPVIEQVRLFERAGFRAEDVLHAIADTIDEEIDSRHYAGPERQLVFIAALALYGLRLGEEERP